jgi:hypothetical protein
MERLRQHWSPFGANYFQKLPAWVARVSPPFEFPILLSGSIPLRAGSWLLAIQEPQERFGQFAADPCDARYFFDWRFPETLDGAKFFQKRLFPIFADAWTIIQDTLGDSFL